MASVICSTVVTGALVWLFTGPTGIPAAARFVMRWFAQPWSIWERIGLMFLAAVGVGLLVAWVLRPWESVRRVGGRARSWPLLPSVAGAVLVGLLLVWIGYAIITHSLNAKPNEPPTRIDVLKTALTAVAGVGGAVALVVAYRRQSDLEQGRFIERFGAAAAQLGDADSAVRIAGVYAMATAADEATTLGRRQQCIDVLCGYLRLPYDPATGASDITEVVTTDNSPASSDLKPGREISTHRKFRQNDRVVRQTIVSVVAAHLQRSANTNWCRCSFDFSGALFEDASFRAADFEGPTKLDRARFTGATSFENVRVVAPISLVAARFDGEASFNNADFAADADFFGVKFRDTASFRDTNFAATASFVGASFGGKALFDYAHFAADASFYNVDFEDNTSFNNVRFNEDARFLNPRFAANASFAGTDFAGHAAFTNAEFAANTSFLNACFAANTSFLNARFAANTSLSGTCFAGTTSFENTEFAADTWFLDARFTAETAFRNTTFAGTTSFSNTHFIGKTSFPDAHFTADTWFKSAHFTGTTKFSEAHFPKDNDVRVDFEGPREWKGLSFDWDTDLSKMPKTVRPQPPNWPPKVVSN